MVTDANLRIGHGIDVHPFQDSRRCVLGGVEIPHHRGLAGHSDADALVHAVMDAILGASGQRDIGTLFPDSDASFKDADSCELLNRLWEPLWSQGWRLINCDVTVLAESPKLKPFVPDMRTRLAGVLRIGEDRIAIKATTTERLGFIGREEGILASAVVLLIKP
jgi:2-C-methyl-D-erythritol 2,4-cyclodiphosphate synthase